MRKKRLRRVGLGGFAAAMASLAGLALFASPASAAGSAAGSPWTVVASPNPGAATTQVELRGVATVSPTEAWAVGSADLHSVIEHFNGTTWTITPNPQFSEFDRLNGVAVTSATDAWAVGSSGDANGGQRGLIEHWNGTAWSIVPSPVLSPIEILYSVAARSATDAWAVGTTLDATVVEHWNGTRWTIVPAPSPGVLENTLASVTILGANDAWAVGTATNGSGEDGIPRPLALHWNGTAWTEVAMPQPADFPDSVMAGVTGVASNDVWAVGNGVVSQLIEHWNGTAWTIVPSPSTSGVLLKGVTAVGHNDVWAVGDGNFFSSGKSFSERWNGTTWNTVPTPTGSQGGELDAVASLPSGLVWAVGGQINDRATFASRSLILRNTAG